MAGSAEKKRLASFKQFLMIFGLVTFFCVGLFIRLRIWRDGFIGFGIWNWIGFTLISVAIGLSLFQVLNSIKLGLPRPDMYYDILITSWIVLILWIKWPISFFILLWLPAYYLYKAWSTMKNLMQTFATQNDLNMQNNNSNGNNNNKSQNSNSNLSRKERRELKRQERKNKKKSKKY